ncbi:hypothetical protein Vi05172_g7174 [Venturia inaequalis]|nr:hypothetical protein Vi05172_g7174 [Venturia inaequalis]
MALALGAFSRPDSLFFRLTAHKLSAPHSPHRDFLGVVQIVAASGEHTVGLVVIMDTATIPLKGINDEESPG